MAPKSLLYNLSSLPRPLFLQRLVLSRRRQLSMANELSAASSLPPSHGPL